MATAEKTYNGWSSYASWGVALVLDNDEGTYNTVRERVSELRESVESHRNVLSGIWTKDEAVRYDFADFVKEYVADLCDLGGGSMMAQQVLQAGLAEVDWDEVAEHYLGEE